MFLRQNKTATILAYNNTAIMAFCFLTYFGYCHTLNSCTVRSTICSDPRLFYCKCLIKHASRVQIHFPLENSIIKSCTIQTHFFLLSIFLRYLLIMFQSHTNFYLKLLQRNRSTCTLTLYLFIQIYFKVNTVNRLCRGIIRLLFVRSTPVPYS